jgi:hypothetical protein
MSTAYNEREALGKIAHVLEEGLMAGDPFGQDHNIVSALGDIADALHHVARAIEGKPEEESR